MKHREEAYDIGGQDQLARLGKQGKKPMRDLIKLLIDPDTDFFEVGLDAGYNIGEKKLYGGSIYEEEKRGHIPGGGVVTGVGTIHGKDCMILPTKPVCRRNLFPDHIEETHARTGHCRTMRAPLHLYRRFRRHQFAAATGLLRR